MTTKELQIENTAAGLVVKGEQLTGSGPKAKNWEARVLDQDRILLVSDQAKWHRGTESEGLSCSSTNVYKDFLTGVHHRGWSGKVLVDNYHGLKTLYFSRGELVFASSNLIDDRLGEIIYREAMISLDQLTMASTQVDRQHKFGQVLIQSGTFTNSMLWKALKIQVQQIFRSTFLVPKLVFEVEENAAPPSTEVVFPEGTSSLIESCFSEGFEFRDFFERLSSNCQISIVQPNVEKDFPTGTFINDFLALVREHPKMEQLLAASKLQDLATLITVHHLQCQGVVKVDGMSAAKKRRQDSSQTILKAKIDAYGFMLEKVRRAFDDSKVRFPIEEVRQFAEELNGGSVATLFLENSGMLAEGSAQGILSQCSANKHRVSYFTIRLESLIGFLLQMSGDLLAREKATELQREYRSLWGA